MLRNAWLKGRIARLASRQVVVALLLLSLFPLARAAGAQTSAQQWHRWEKELRTTRDYHQILINGVLEKDNPYRKLTVRVTYTPVSCAVPSGPWCQAFTGYGFWDGGRVFKIRGSFPAGTWNFAVTCTGSSGGFDCSTDTILNQSGSITVTNDNTNEDSLFERGFVRRSTNSGLKYLTYGDGQAPFFWRADTAWSPASVQNIDNATSWSTFLNDRKAKNFNTIMMGVAPDGDNASNATLTLWDDVNQADAPCGTAVVWPRPCSRWRAAFWQKFEEKVRLANEAGFLVVIIGIMDPQGNPKGGPLLYPDQTAAALFARNLAARLAGDHVIFSPSFDDKLSTTRTLLDAVGTALADAAPRHLLTAHLAGGSSICDYYDMHNTTKHPWHKVHIFQSGHAFNTTNCITTFNEEDPYECAVRRAREFPDQLSPTPTSSPGCADPAPTASTVKPNANGEAAYDNTYTRSGTQAIDTPYGVRHTGYNSALNGAFGVTLGVQGIWDWTNVSSGPLNSDGSNQMKYLGERFDLSPWQMLQRRSARITNQPANTNADQYMTLAAALDSTFAMAYMPDDLEMKFDGTFLTGFDCTNSSTWTVTWYNPKTGLPQVPGGTCANIAEGSATRKLTRPTCGGSGSLGDCDWVVVLKKTTSPSGFSSFSDPGLEVWTEPSPDGSAWRIMGRRKDAPSQEASFAISEPAPAGVRLKLPVVARDPQGDFSVIWETEDDGSLHGIVMRKVDGQGRLLDHEYPVNVERAYDQTHPWLVLGGAGKGGVATWTSYAQDGDSGGIFARLVNPAGVPFGREIQVNQHVAGRQDFSKAVMDAQGGFVVAWTSQDQDGDAEGVYARRFDAKGNPLGPEVRVNETTAGGQWLTDLQLTDQGGVLVSWTSYAPDGSELGVFGRSYDAQGSPLGGELLVVPPPALRAGEI